MTEAFLFHAWQCRLFNNNNLFTSEGEPLRIIHPGLLNTNAGPDFMNARIRIGETLWAGNVEIHVKAGDWKKHLHHEDQSYSNIILHIVYEADQVIKRPDGSDIPVLILKDKIDEQAWKNYQYLITSRQWIPCAPQIKDAPGIVVDLQLSRMVTERLERKTLQIVDDLRLNKNNWEETFYRYLARNFGFKVNAVPFELLAKTLPENLLARHKTNLFQIEALLFGTGGFLQNEFSEVYPLKLKEEFIFLQHKYNIKNMQEHLWKFLRLRPANFPTIRIAQFSTLVVKSHHLFSRVLETEKISDLEKLLAVDVSDYWKNHFSFGTYSAGHNKPLGLASVHNILVNTIIPFLFVYGTQKGIPDFRERALNFLEQLPAEKNNLITGWQQLGIISKSASDSQGLLELKNNYCDAKKCLQCSIGNMILRNENRVAEKTAF